MIFAGITMALLSFLGAISLFIDGQLIGGFISLVISLSFVLFIKKIYGSDRIKVNQGTSMSYAQDHKEQKKKKSKYDCDCACDAIDCGCDALD